MRLFILAALTLTTLLTGCAVEVGDACVNAADCDGMICDTTAPSGYCTEYGCTLNSCPDEAVCVDFGELDACMRRCEDDNDCRDEDGYVCRQDRGSVGFCYIPESTP